MKLQLHELIMDQVKGSTGIYGTGSSRGNGLI